MAWLIHELFETWVQRFLVHFEARTKMTRLQVALPDNAFTTLRQAPHELERELPLAAAIHWYQQGRISMEKAAELATLSRPEFLAELARRKVDVFVVDFEDLRQELADG